jgi:hypothetical protein
VYRLFVSLCLIHTASIVTVERDKIMRVINILVVVVLVAIGAVLLGAAFFYPVYREVGGVNELTFTRTGGFAGLDERLHVRENGTADYISNRFGNTTLQIDKADVSDLLNKTDFFTTDKVYNAVSGAADYFIYGLTVQKGFNVTTIQWVDQGATNETLPPQLLEIQNQIENIIQRARNTSAAQPSAAQQQATEIAKEFIVQAPTFKFDGINETLSIIDTVVLESYPEQYVTTLTFDSRHAGYGDRTGQVLAQVITPHTARTTVVNNSVTSATLDSKWDELNQKPLKQTIIILEPKQALNLAMTYIKENHPDAAEFINDNMTWNATRTTPEGIVGHETYAYESGNWKATMEWNVVAPEYLTYKITAQHTSGITWTGEVHEDQVTETSYKTS